VTAQLPAPKRVEYKLLYSIEFIKSTEQTPFGVIIAGFALGFCLKEIFINKILTLRDG